MAKEAYYAVRVGRAPGIYRTWEECQAQVIGHPNAAYKKCTNLEAAIAFVEYSSSASEVHKGVPVYVDGSFDVNSMRASYGVVILNDVNEPVILSGICDEKPAMLRNVCGEIYGVIQAMLYCAEHDIRDITIYHDYAGLSKWYTGEWKATKDLTHHYRDFCNKMAEVLSFEFVKVKSHSGNEYNDMADEAAKKALQLS